MKILFVISSLTLGGAERQLVELAKSLRGRGHHVAVAISYSGFPLETELASSGVELIDLRKGGRLDLIGYLGRLLSLIKKQQPDVLHSYLTVPNLATALASLIFRHVPVVWGVRASDMQMEHYDWLSRTTESAAAFLARFADRIIVNSHAGLEHHVQTGFPESRMQVIHNGIDTDRFVRDSSGRASIRAAWGTRENELLIGIVGRLDPMKGHHVFFEAAAHVASLEPDVRFVCIGSGREEIAQTLRRQVQVLGIANRVIWQEAIPQPVPYYSALDGLCSASFSEGFSNVIAEAMSCGLPCVVTNVGDSRMIVDALGYVVPPSDAMSLSDALLRLIGDLRNGRIDRTAIRRRIVNKFSVERLVVQTESALLDVVSTNTRGRKVER